MSEFSVDINTVFRCRLSFLTTRAEDNVKKKNEEVASSLSRGKIVHVEGARHNVRRDEKERVLVALKAFLTEL